ncbi:MAG: HAD family hydrolase [Thermoleophilaceae bacterium]
MRLLLWDIDGTLIHAGSHGRVAFADAFGQVFGRPTDIEDLPMSGRTDHAICLELLERNGVTGGEEHLPAMFEALHAALVKRRDAMAAEGRVMPGVPRALEALGGRDDVHQSLLTGNIEANAHVKLGAFGLDRLVDMEVGGYGSDSGIRPELVDVAREKAARLRGIDVEARDTVLIGDTPLDVHAAHVNGARAVALATGSFASAELRATGAEAVLEDASDLDALLDAVLA